MLTATIKLNLEYLNGEEKENYIRNEMKKRVNANARHHYHIAQELYEMFPFLHDEWNYYPQEHFIRDRFTKKEHHNYITQIEINTTITENHQLQFQKKTKYVHCI